MISLFQDFTTYLTSCILPFYLNYCYLHEPYVHISFSKRNNLFVLMRPKTPNHSLCHLFHEDAERKKIDWHDYKAMAEDAQRQGRTFLGIRCLITIYCLVTIHCLITIHGLITIHCLITLWYYFQ